MTPEEQIHQLKAKLQLHLDAFAKEKKELYKEMDILRTLCNDWMFKAIIKEDAEKQRDEIKQTLAIREVELNSLRSQLSSRPSSNINVTSADEKQALHSSLEKAKTLLIEQEKLVKENEVLRRDLSNVNERLQTQQLELADLRRRLEEATKKETEQKQNLTKTQQERDQLAQQLESAKSSQTSLMERASHQTAEAHKEREAAIKAKDELIRLLRSENVDMGSQLELLKRERQTRQASEPQQTSAPDYRQDIEGLRGLFATLQQRAEKSEERETLLTKELERAVAQIERQRVASLDSLRDWRSILDEKTRDAQTTWQNSVAKDKDDLEKRVNAQWQAANAAQAALERRLASEEDAINSLKRGLESLRSPTGELVERLDARFAGRLEQMKSSLQEQIEQVRHDSNNNSVAIQTLSSSFAQFSSSISSSSSSSSSSSLNGRPSASLPAPEASLSLDDGANPVATMERRGDVMEDARDYSPIRPTHPQPTPPASVPSTPTSSKKRANPEEDVIETPTRVSKRSRGKEPKTPQVVVCFSGFKDEGNLRQDLIDKVVKLGGSCRTEADFDKSITHVVTPQGVRTLKSLAALLTKRWLVSADWIIHSDASGHFISEEPFGKKQDKSPLKGKKFFISDSFKKEASSKGNNNDRLQSCQTIICLLGRGKIVETGEADYMLVGSKDKETTYKNAIALNWGQFMDLITTTTNGHEDKSRQDEDEDDFASQREIPSSDAKKRVRFDE